tara:strand:+ start:5012 stop:5275 length:264 start_codon:yes stop_codon:yes gene_type:complete
MNKSVNVVPIHEDPTELALQFDVKLDGDKDKKFTQKQIFELAKDNAKKKKLLSKTERRKINRAKAEKGSALSQKKNEELRKKGYDIG